RLPGPVARGQPLARNLADCPGPCGAGGVAARHPLTLPCSLPVAVCEGNFTCKDNEVCVRPSECRCRHGYFGANCETKCPRQFWGPDCKEMCQCHPNGQCEDVTGQCTCNANRWGPKCENACLCKHGKCDQRTGKCSCEPSWWGPQCSSACYCSLNSQCDQQSGSCLCQPGWWGRSCNNQCACSSSPCEQFTGRCQCRGRTFGPRCDRYCQCHMGKCSQVDGACTCEPGYRGKFCREPCPAGFYGQGCRRRCGQCKELQPCTIVDGRCLACEAGWNGTKCDQVCSAGFYGEGCDQVCPPCKDGHTCNHINGKCSHCNPGWIGDRCETKCRNGTYGENCAFVCSDCFNGECHFETGRCLCKAGFHGASCNLTCPVGHYGVNCEESCNCREDSCNPLTGTCHMEANQRMGVVGAVALLAFLLILLLSLLSCCCICRKKDRARDPSQTPAHEKPPKCLCGRFSRISMKLPRIPLHRQKLPKVVGKQEHLTCPAAVPPADSRVASLTGGRHVRGAWVGPQWVLPHGGTAGKMRPPPYLRHPPSPMNLANPADCSEAPLLKSSDSERSSCGSGSVSGALYARIARLSKQSRDDDESATEGKNAKPPSPERAKPPPPDPSTKPKISWIHSKYNSNQSNSLPAIAAADLSEHKHGLAKRKRSPSETSSGAHSRADDKAPPRGKEKAPKQPKDAVPSEGRAPAAMGSCPPERKAGEEPKGPGHGKPRSEVVHPHLSLEAATLLAAQLKEKTQSLNRGDGGVRQNGVSPLPAQRERPTPPQKARRSVATSGQKSSKPQSSTGSPELAPAPSEQVVKKTPIKKPPRKKTREATADQPKAATTPTQTVP
uniref:Scavenger receptor class F member 2 n=1 Tax=Varanus komodoensis TaxID=61221 RepID=A0A8D2PZU8_VARKO